MFFKRKRLYFFSYLIVKYNIDIIHRGYGKINVKPLSKRNDFKSIEIELEAELKEKQEIDLLDSNIDVVFTAFNLLD